jgi:hypothetical protein
MGMVARYEALRAAVLGNALSPEARSGLTLFLRRGMWGWAQAMTVVQSVSQRRVLPPSAAWSSTHDGKCAVVHLLAAIAMGSNDDRRSP